MAKGRKTGGRRKGVPNKTTLEREKAIAATGETPKDYMLRVMRDESVDAARRDAMARAVAPFCHPHLQSVAHTGEGGGPIVVERIERVIIDSPANRDRAGVPALVGAGEI